jgi:GNAT-family acetyltransferase (TIGR03103 family)
MGGRTVLTRESLSEFTSAVAMSRCDDKRVTRRIMERAGVRVPRGVLAREDDLAAATALLEECGEVVVKPARGEQGKGITVGVRDAEGLARAVASALQFCPDVLVEELVAGEDLRVVVIDHRVVAAAVRRPAEVVGDGRSTVRALIESTSRRRERATGGESRIPLDDTTAAVVADAAHGMDDVLPAGERLRVRRTANLHTGGTIEDVTDRLHPAIAEAAVEASRAIGIPVTGLDFLVPDVEGPEHVFIEANERPGLANHEPQPTAQRFVDLLFPETRAR